MVTNTTETMEVAASAEASLVETGEKRDRLGRKITPVGRRRELVGAWRQSGLTQAEFARREGLNYSSFANWVQEERKATATGTRRAAKPVAAVRFAEVRVPATLSGGGTMLEARLSDGTVLRGGSAKELAALMRALRA